MKNTNPQKPGRKREKQSGLKISELAEITGVSKQAIHFYLREGLLHSGRKTSHNMAYYDDSHVERINLIKRMQENNRLKLSEIKEILSGKVGSTRNGAALLDSFGFLPRDDLKLSAGELIDRSGLSEEDLDELLGKGIITAVDDESGEYFGAASLELARLAKAILEAGYSRDYLLNVLEIFRDESKSLAKREIENYFKRPLPGQDIGVLAETFRDTEPYLEKAFWMLRRVALGKEANRILDDFSFFSWITGKQLEDVASPILPSDKYLKPLDVESVIDVLKKNVEEGRGDAASYINLGVIYYTRGDKEEQRKWVLKAIEEDPENQWALILLADSYASSNESDKAEKVLAGCIEAHPDFALALCLHAISVLETVINEKRLENVVASITGALNELELAGEIEIPEGFEQLVLYSLRGRALLLLPDFIGVFDDAVEDLKKGLKSGERQSREATDPYHRTAVDSLIMNFCYDLGRAAERSGNIQERDKYWNKLLKIDPDNIVAPDLKAKMKEKA
ncbi:MAG: MerR family transcriptional regulator [Actinobacteria bacterium]|nr:MerR family transcriptional regulator [Actinomycetota bacterium]